MRRKLAFMLVIIGIAILFIGCTKPAVLQTDYERTKTIGQELTKQTNQFEKKKKKLGEQITYAIAQVNEDKSKSAREKLFKEWEKAVKEYKELKKDYEKIGEKKEKYFKQLSKLTDQIKDKELREKNKLRNNKLNEKFTMQYTKTGQVLREIKTVIQRGSDLTTSVKISHVIGVINTNINKLVDIRKEAKKLLQKLRKLRVKGDKILKTNASKL
ncbi:hypothetical protein [Halanaerobacter jeridensis]|uniref:Cell-wall binding lipoprotein n=1 Tax=Halanaerobacter jeridensis TaxID=706427 RepID=A0A939BRY1_9FIRM|nr:hypothetical protein [Halanaerobacter jeridensis]MBM7557799.1 hypothetical protein [Halanaerobacter jeridensis]